MFRYPFGFWYDGEMAGLAAAGRVARATRADTADPALMVHTKAAQVTSDQGRQGGYQHSDVRYTTAFLSEN